MSFAKFWQCCFPRNKQQVVKEEEESISHDNDQDDTTLKNITDEKRVELPIKKNKNEEEFEIVKSKLLGKGLSNTSNSPYADNKKGLIENSFTSFAAKKQDIIGNVKTNVENSINILKDLGAKRDTIDLNTNTSIKGRNSAGVSGHTTINKPSISINDTKTDVSGNLGNLQNNTNFYKINSSNNMSNSFISRNKKMDETLDIINSQRIISEEEIKNAPELILEEIKGEMLKNNKLVINAGGLMNGLRKAKDGLVFFGASSKQKDEYFLNDVELTYPEKDLSSNRIFYIYYKKETNRFYLKNQNKAKIKMHIKLSSEIFYPILKKEIILIDEMYFQVIPHSDGKLEINNLGIGTISSDKKLDKENTARKYIFEKNEYKSVTIGRDSSCTISFPGDKSFSKIHTTIIYDKENQYWKIKDGSIDKASTNGTWIFANHSYEIMDNTIFQLATSNFLIKFRV